MSVDSVEFGSAGHPETARSGTQFFKGFHSLNRQEQSQRNHFFGFFGVGLFETIAVFLPLAAFVAAVLLDDAEPETGFPVAFATVFVDVNLSDGFTGCDFADTEAGFAGDFAAVTAPLTIVDFDGGAAT